MRRPRASAGTCIAPLGEVPQDGLEGVALCGAPATTTRVVEGLTCALCELHAREIDNERAADDAQSS